MYLLNKYIHFSSNFILSPTFVFSCSLLSRTLEKQASLLLWPPAHLTMKNWYVSKPRFLPGHSYYVVQNRFHIYLLIYYDHVEESRL